MNRNRTTDTNQASEGEIRETIERLLRFNCPNGCDGNGSYPEMSSDGEWEQGQCQWCFEYGMPARDAIQALIRNEKLKAQADILQEGVSESKEFCGEDVDINLGWVNFKLNELQQSLTKLEAEL